MRGNPHAAFDEAGAETWHGRDGVTLADKRASQQGTQTSTYTGAPVLDPTDERDGRRGDGQRPQATAPILNSTEAVILSRCWSGCHGRTKTVRRRSEGATIEWLASSGRGEYSQLTLYRGRH